jgi:hypothetical protein
VAEEQAQPGSEWLAMSDADFEEIHEKAALVLRTIPGLVERSEAMARATLAQQDSHEIETVSRKRLVDALLAYANGNLQQAEYVRGLLGMLESTWRCLAEIRTAYRREVAQREARGGGTLPPEGGDDGG